MTFAPPPGFVESTRPSPLIDPWRPLYVAEYDDRAILALQVREAHCNSRGTVHGGLYAALVDQAAGQSASICILARGWPLRNLLTTSLTVDYLGPATIGQWLEFDTHFAEGGRSLWYTEVDITADGVTVARGRATFRVSLHD